MSVSPIRQAIVYAGHRLHSLFGPYCESIDKRIALLYQLNTLRLQEGLNPWTIRAVSGEELIGELKKYDPQDTLLVVPAGESSRLDAVFSQEESQAIKQDFLEKGGRGYFTCGAAYWAAERRIYRDVCEMQPEKRNTIEKTSKLALFRGIAHGPLCLHPGNPYRAGFYSDAVQVIGSGLTCSVFLGGGGSFLPRGPNVSVIARYLPSELSRIGKPETEHPQWENAAVIAPVGAGAVLLSMFHPYYGDKDIDPETYARAFPHSGTDWAAVKRKLSPLQDRLQFAHHAMMRQLEK